MSVSLSLPQLVEGGGRDSDGDGDGDGFASNS